MEWKYDDLELTTLACLFLHPECMEGTILEDKYFKNRRAVWIYMKTFYQKFKTFDLSLMTSFAKNKNKVLDVIMALMDYEPVPSNFKLYEKRLIEMYEQEEKEKRLIDIYYQPATDLFLGNIKLQEYKERLKRMEEKNEKGNEGTMD